MLSNPILGSADLPITAVHERSDLSFVITSQKTRLMSLFPFCWISVASSTCSFPCSVRTIFIRVIQKAGTNRLYGNFVFSPALHIHLFHKTYSEDKEGNWPEPGSTSNTFHYSYLMWSKSASVLSVTNEQESLSFHVMACGHRSSEKVSCDLSEPLGIIP